VGDLLALSAANDPFYVGRPSEMEAATWFADIWRRFSYAGKVHLRRVHYQIVSQEEPIRKPDGKPYENTERDWGYLTNASKWARYLDLVPASMFEDKRNQAPNIHYIPPQPFNNEEPSLDVVDAWEVLDLPGYELSNYRAEQPYLVELWVEKTTMNDVLDPLCVYYGANLVTGAGELSITAVIEFLGRVREAGKPARILYISDFDPAGMGMPISVARKIEYYQRQYGFDDLDIALDPIVLTQEQVRTYRLPRVPVKDSDRRKASWIDAYGAGQTELDALEALHPGELDHIVREAIHHYYDADLIDETEARRTELRAILERLEANIREDYADEITELQSQIENLQQAIRERLEIVAPNIDDFALPESDPQPETNGVLYTSTRTYFEQLHYYKIHRNNGNGDPQ